MTTPYRALFAAPGTLRLVLAGLLARLALPMTGIGIITMLSQLHGSYAMAGAVSSTFVLTYALLSPHVSRLVDRHGQDAILPVACILSVTGMLLLAAAAWLRGPDWSLFIGALLAGCMPSISAMVRARWTVIHRNQPHLQSAYSLETVLDEVTFIVGPPMAIMLSVALFSQAGLLVAALLLSLGVAALIAQRGSAPPLTADNLRIDPQRSVIRQPNVQMLTILMAAMGMIVGTVDITSVAFTAQLGQPAAASLILSAYAAGSCLAGLWFGAHRFHSPLPRLLLLGGLATAASTIPLVLASSLVTLTLAVLLAGIFFAPTMIVAMSLVAQLVPAHRLTEGMTWLLAGLNMGVAAGAAVAGRVVDGDGASAGFTVALFAGAAVLLVVLQGHRRLRASSISPSESA